MGQRISICLLFFFMFGEACSERSPIIKHSEQSTCQRNETSFTLSPPSQPRGPVDDDLLSYCSKHFPPRTRCALHPPSTKADCITLLARSAPGVGTFRTCYGLLLLQMDSILRLSTITQHKFKTTKTNRDRATERVLQQSAPPV